MDKTRLQAYEIVREETLPDIHSKGTILRHKKTGARVMLIENEDENKVFNIAFRTPPADSTGVAHILEHSVLCGSREFPLKDPFVELVKGSLNTFLNAITFPDKTCYPVASCNDRDFKNLMHVYLDAVFYPNIYQREEIFRQEGWDYHLDSPEGPLTISGVVYNEMKGAFSSPDDVLERAIMDTLFPDTCYGVESGGDPERIPDLTYENFLNFHRTYYHPSNSFIYLYGDMDMNERLDFLDEKYLSHFDALAVDSRIRTQAPFEAMVLKEDPYPVAENDSEEENTYLSWNVVTDEKLRPVQKLGLAVLDYVLLSAPGAPLKKALLDAGIGKDIYGSYEDGIRQPYFSVIAKGSERDRQEEFVRIIRDVLTQVIEEGVDEKAWKAGLNLSEFRYREADFSSYPKGLVYLMDILGDWLYSDEDPFGQVKQIGFYRELEQEVAKGGFFENLIRSQLLENSHGSILTLYPEKGLASKKDAALANMLGEKLSAMTEDQKSALIDRTEKLQEYQEAEEDPEVLTCIPMLERGDIKKEAAKLYNTEYDLDGTLFLHHDVVTNGIGYLDLMFETPRMSLEMIHYMGLLKAVIGAVDTEHYTYGELANEVNAGTGGISYGVELFQNPAVSGFRAMFSIRAKALYQSLDFLFDLLKEIITTSKLSDHKRVREILQRVVSRSRDGLVSGGHGTAVLRATSYASESAAFQDEMSGIGFYHFAEALDKDFEGSKDKITEGLTKALKLLLRPERLLVSYTGEPESLAKVQERVKDLKTCLFTGEVHDTPEDLDVTKKNEGFLTAGQVQYVAESGNFLNKGLAYTGALSILKVILSYDYLWMNIRVKGGAYGCMTGFKRSGEGFFVSYRDPHLHKTLEVFDGVPAYIEAFDADEREMTKYIIGTISGMDTPRTPQMQGSVSRTAYFDGVTEEMLQRERDEILSATPEKIRALAAIARAVLSDRQICVVGSETVVGKAGDVLKEIRPLING